MHSEATKAEALRLRCEGQRTLREIASTLKVSISTLSLWVGQHDLDDGQRHDRASKAGAERWARRDARKRAAVWFAPEEPDFLQGLLLYWCEGAKDRLQFSNGDPRMFAIVVPWMSKYLGCRAVSAGVDLFDDQDADGAVRFWKGHFPNLTFGAWRKGPSKRKSKCVRGMCKMSFSDARIGALIVREWVERLYGAERFDMPS